jgi:hypothetical protein
MQNMVFCKKWQFKMREQPIGAVFLMLACELHEKE